MVWWQTMIRSFRAWSRWTWWCAKIFASFELFMSDGWCQCQRSNPLTSLATHSKRYKMRMGKAKSHVSIVDRSQIWFVYIYILYLLHQMEPNCSRKVNSNCSRRFYLWESGIRMLTVLKTFHFLTLVYEKYDCLTGWLLNSSCSRRFYLWRAAMGIVPHW
jgi:hypothetical protein